MIDTKKYGSGWAGGLLLTEMCVCGHSVGEHAATSPKCVSRGCVCDQFQTEQDVAILEMIWEQPESPPLLPTRARLKSTAALKAVGS
jgi:hypothetical protein